MDRALYFVKQYQRGNLSAEETIACLKDLQKAGCITQEECDETCKKVE